MSLIRIISNNNICRFQISMNITLGMDAVESVQKLECNYDYCLNWKLTFLEGLLQLFQINPQKLHHKIVIVLIRTIWVKSGKSNSSVFRGIYLRCASLLRKLLLLLKFSVKLYCFRILVIDAVFSKRLFLLQLHHVFHQRNLSLKFRFVFTWFFHL